jgi:hypothetical protein
MMMMMGLKLNGISLPVCMVKVHVMPPEELLRDWQQGRACSNPALAKS